jgi:hypothetical protein
MKKQAFSVFMMLSLFVTLAVVSVYGQLQRSLAVKVPFNFVVGETTLPAGEYTIEPSSIGTAAALLIRSAEGHMGVTFFANPVEANAIQAEAKVVFNRYGDRYFLAQVWTPEINIGRELVKSRLEPAQAKSGSKPETAILIAHQR